jgi:hypothetical protein
MGVTPNVLAPALDAMSTPNSSEQRKICRKDTLNPKDRRKSSWVVHSHGDASVY